MDPVHGVPRRTQEDTLLLATWNIRDFDKPAYGERGEEPIHYIAEIISRFDLVAIQEVYRDLGGLERVMDMLGSDWDFLVTDAGEGNRANDERLAYVYDTRKVKFAGLAGELVLPPIEGPGGEPAPPKQLARTPYIAGFRSGWTDFVLCTVHILYGSNAPDNPERINEIRQLAGFLSDRSVDPAAWSRNVVVLGDFNIFSPEDETMKALLDNDFVIPEEIRDIPGSNVPKNKKYDQIAFRVRPGKLDTTGRAGVFDFFDVVYREQDEAEYVEAMGESYNTTSRGEPRENKSLYYKTYWRTQQMSDHLPMWVELRINYTETYLKRLQEARQD